MGPNRKDRSGAGSHSGTENRGSKASPPGAEGRFRPDESGHIVNDIFQLRGTHKVSLVLPRVGLCAQIHEAVT